MRRLLVPVLALLLAGCTTTSSGKPTAGEGPTGPAETTSATSTTTTSAEVTRPRNIDLAAIDLCQVVGGLPLATFGLDTNRPPLAGDSATFPGAKDCFANGVAQNLSLLVVAVTDQGVAEYLDGANAEVDQADANGFPLSVLTTPASPDSCFGALDVNDGQMLFINYGLSAPGTQPATPQATLCQRVPDIARAALAKL
jgi:uncharacterized protein DUF3558